MTSTLATVVGNIINRVLEMELLAVTDAETRASKEWIYWSQKTPYWINAMSSLSNTEKGKWDLSIDMRLVVCHVSQATKGATSPQDKVWSYIPEVMAYFSQYGDLRPPGKTDIAYLHPAGAIIDCPGGLSIFSVQGQKMETLIADFVLSVPIQIL